MQNTGFFSKDNLKRKALPYLFTTALMAALTNLYIGNPFNVYTLVSMLLTFGIYAMCDFMMKHKKLAIPIYLLAMTASNFLIMSIFSTAPAKFPIFEWFMTGGETIDTIPQYMLVVVLGLAFFISSVTYYFSHVIYRVAIFTLLSLIPCAIYVKAAEDVPLVLISAAAVLNIFIFISNCRSNHAEKHVVKGAHGFTAYMDFAVAAVIFALILPKPSVAPYYEKFEEFSNNFAFWGKANGLSGEYSEHSGNADNYQDMESRLIYNVYTDTPQYLKIQVFDEYDAENRWWTASKKLDKGFRQWEPNASQQNLNSLYKVYTETDSAVLSKQKNDIASLENDTVKYARIQAIDYPSQFVIAPVRATKAVLNNRTDEPVLRGVGYELYPSATSVHSSGSFDLNYYDERFARSSGWITSGLCDLTVEEFFNVMTEALGALMLQNDEYKQDPLYKTIKAYRNEAEQALEFAPSKYAPVSDEIQRISDEITAGLVYDYEKAFAIESYFNQNGFIYDIGYRAEEELDTPEYFLTVSQRGTCSDYATAYCLLARAAGLTVRYVEGFLADPSETLPNTYEIYTEDAHAYAEVYLPGAGWTVFDGSVVDITIAAESSNTNEEETEPDFLTIFITCLAIFISIALVILLIILMPSIERAVFGLRIKALPPEKSVILIYGRLAAYVKALCDRDTSVMTSAQLGEYILSYTGISADDIIIPFERVCYGGLSAEKSDAEKGHRLLKEIVSAIRKINKEKRKSSRA